MPMSRDLRLPEASTIVGGGGSQPDARAIYEDDGATLDDLREAVATLEDTDRTGQRVLGRAHPLVGSIENLLRDARAVLRTAQHLTKL